MTGARTALRAALLFRQGEPTKPGAITPMEGLDINGSPIPTVTSRENGRWVTRIEGHGSPRGQRR